MQAVNDTPASFPTTSRNRVKRLHERGSYDHAAVFAVLDAGLLCHVAYTFDGQPYCTPTIHWREDDMLYWHGSSASRMLRNLRGGTPACLTVSHLDGLVLARSGFNHSANYRSAMCFGTARIIDEPDEKLKALAGVVDRFYPGRSETLRPISAQEAKATMVIGMRIEEASSKVRQGGRRRRGGLRASGVGRRHPGADGGRRRRAVSEAAARCGAAAESGWLRGGRKVRCGPDAGAAGV
jgi:nitroimidazol reductase NimA-like FMN-containing flavoprotein (pyridoxamine 5'-phosphate oxidase superfamily)